MMRICKATAADLDRICAVYRAAKAYMDATGNPNQWRNGYPRRDMLESDIGRGELYTVRGEDGEIHGVFLLALGADPTYTHIEDGAWKHDRPYGTLHRVASDGTLRGIFHAAVGYAKGVIPELRVDTHADNAPMQCAILREGFTRCGIIYVEDGTPRIAYQL